MNWKKWTAVDEHLHVAFEYALKAGVYPRYREGIIVPPVEQLEKDNMIHPAKVIPSRIIGQPDSKETVDRHYAPRVSPFPDLERTVKKVVFKKHILLASEGGLGLFTNIVLEHYSRPFITPSRLFCGRAKELKPENQNKAFGFNTRREDGGRKRHPNYVPLSYPGETGSFEPVFIKVKEMELLGGGYASYYLKVEAHDEGEDKVVVEVRMVDIRNVPAFLREVN